MLKSEAAPYAIKARGRGKLLIAVLAADSIGLLLLLLNLVAWINNSHILDGLYPGAAPGIVIAYRATCLVISTTILVGIIRWKRIAVHVFFAFWMTDLILSLTVFAVDPARLQPPPMPVVPAVLVYLAADIVVAVVWFLAIRRKWAYFT